MKLVRFEDESGPAYGALEGESVRRIEGDIFGEWRTNGEAVPLSGLKLLAPVQPPQIICIGLNYYGHAKECNFGIPAEPLIFLKGVNALAGPGDAIALPDVAPDFVDYEGELAIVIGRRAKNISEADADKYILGYTCGNDVSARDCQLKRDGQWARGKSFDTFAPLGPAIATGLDPDSLRLKVELNGRTVQDSNTSDMICPCRKLVSYVSRSMTLLPGAVIMTGTPGGVGHFRKEPFYLKRGDTVSVEIEGIGRLENVVETVPVQSL